MSLEAMSLEAMSLEAMSFPWGLKPPARAGAAP